MQHRKTKLAVLSGDTDVPGLLLLAIEDLLYFTVHSTPFISRTGFPQLAEIHKTLSQQFFFVFFPFSLFMAQHPLKMTTEEVDGFTVQLKSSGMFFIPQKCKQVRHQRGCHLRYLSLTIKQIKMPHSLDCCNIMSQLGKWMSQRSAGVEAVDLSAV